MRERKKERKRWKERESKISIHVIFWDTCIWRYEKRHTEY